MTNQLIINAKPRRNLVKGEMNTKNCVRSYRCSPEDMLLQLRLDNAYVSVALSFEDAKKLGEFLISKGA